jgi:PKD repeat protein
MVNGTGPFEYEWDFGDGVTSTLESPTHMYEWADTFTVTVTVTSDWGSFTLSDQFVVNAPVENYEYIYLPLVGKGP